MDYDDHGHMAMPKLVGGPKYSRPPVTGVRRVERPPDPDDLPLVSERTAEDEALARELGLEPAPRAHAIATDSGAPAAAEGVEAALHPNGIWTAATGTAEVDAPSWRRALGIRRGRNGRPGIG